MKPTILILCILLCGCAEFSETKCVERCRWPEWIACREKCGEKACKLKTTPIRGKQTGNCKIFDCYSDGELDDCGTNNCRYVTIQCDDELYWGWPMWNNVEEEKGVFIKGNQYFVACLYTEDDCIYEFNMEDLK